jgi:hypothetical protein
VGGVGHPALYFDAQDGKLLGDRIPWQGSVADVFVQAQFPLQSGRILGMPGRIPKLKQANPSSESVVAPRVPRSMKLAELRKQGAPSVVCGNAGWGILSANARALSLEQDPMHGINMEP